MLVGVEAARQIDAAPGDVTVDVDASRHHHHSARVDPTGSRDRLGDDAAVCDVEIAHDAVDAVSRVVDGASDDMQR
jgi:hypothetical protein